MSFTFTCRGKCLRCGNENFTSLYRPADFAPVTCLSCGHLMTVRDAIHTTQEPGTEPPSDLD